MPNWIEPLIINGHVYVGRFQNVPCPWKGWEDCTIGVVREGVPAYWRAGFLYLLDRRLDPADFQKEERKCKR